MFATQNVGMNSDLNKYPFYWLELGLGFGKNRSALMQF